MNSVLKTNYFHFAGQSTRIFRFHHPCYKHQQLIIHRRWQLKKNKNCTPHVYLAASDKKASTICTITHCAFHSDFVCIWPKEIYYLDSHNFFRVVFSGFFLECASMKALSPSLAFSTVFENAMSSFYWYVKNCIIVFAKLGIFVTLRLCYHMRRRLASSGNESLVH